MACIISAFLALGLYNANEHNGLRVLITIRDEVLVPVAVYNGGRALS